MFKSQVFTGSYEVIANGSVFSISQKPDNVPPLKGYFPELKPINIEIFEDNISIFLLIFEFIWIDSNQDNLKVETKPLHDSKTLKFIIRNIGKSDDLFIDKPWEIASNDAGDKFYIIFTAKKMFTNILLNYTIYVVRGENNGH